MALKTNNQKKGNPTLDEWARRFKEHPFRFCGIIVVLIIVIVAFVLVPALPGVVDAGVSVEFGSYNKTPITLVPGNYFAEQVQNYENTYRFYYGSSYDASNMFMSYQIWRSAFEDTVLHIAALEEMKNVGYDAPSEVVDREVAALPLFQENGRFSSIKYRSLDNTRRLALWRQVRDSIIAQRYASAAVEKLPVSSKEAAFISTMGSTQRTFSMVLFSLYDYPDSELAPYAAANAELFRVTHLSRITINSNEREAQKILTSVKDGAATFEDAARNHSQDSFAETGGDMGVKMAHELTSEIPSEENRELLLNLPKGELSPVIALSTGWAFFRAEEDPHAPDMSDSAMLSKVKLYIMDFAKGRVEDWYIARANTLITSIKSEGFDEALALAELETTNFGPVPLNYGNVSLFTTLESLTDASAIASIAATNENFWRTAFSTPVETPSQPIVIGNYVAVLYPVSETPLDETSIAAIEDSYPSRVSSFMNQALRSYVLSSEKLEDHFSDAYFNNFQ
ncbi:MAG: SurA N-terminal domain-containing protein [Treponema sp.]|jgi:hypothetical protein|nr:SurA N-terminal domain-containing protein [Treponema sp.]